MIPDRTAHDHFVPGPRPRTGDIQARRDNAAYYNRKFAGTVVQTPYISPDCETIYNQYCIRVPRRDEVVAHLHGPPPVETDALSRREGQVLALLAEGAANKEIARRLDISERTVKAHVTAIMHKLGVSNRTQAVLAANRLAVANPNSAL